MKLKQRYFKLLNNYFGHLQSFEIIDDPINNPLKMSHGTLTIDTLDINYAISKVAVFIKSKKLKPIFKIKKLQKFVEFRINIANYLKTKYNKESAYYLNKNYPLCLFNI